MNNKKFKVAVYGSLKKGFENDLFLTKGKFLFRTTTKEAGFKMLNLFNFPAVIKNEKDGYKIKVEVYEIDQKILEILDEIEGNGRLYQREECKLTKGGKAFVYYLCNKDVIKDGIEIDLAVQKSNNVTKKVIIENNVASWEKI